ncbi:hypothetical protein [Kutzneria albida]|uniref:Blue (type 1) copper domain-containing protein n=1 Tax=Kutzneria albida DSM 43870 TaxID=1449976 RepID=W5WH97_9PSEU|nr:hypothetical protein [Kutzneria albida]AHH97549.1 hypothetical protein KALB_4185 [Kutzneria albida DSM 43870]
MSVKILVVLLTATVLLVGVALTIGGGSSIPMPGTTGLWGHGRMMGDGRRDPGTAMGAALADAPGPRVSAAQATELAQQIPAGASVDRTARQVTLSGSAVSFAAVASQSSMYSFQIAGMTNPSVTVPTGARVSIQVINADDDMAHGVVVTMAHPTSWMPMMAAGPAFPGAGLFALGESTSAGLHTATITFTAGTPGRYTYLCAVADHARRGMLGSFTIQDHG